jgi:hypothetical protein
MTRGAFIRLVAMGLAGARLDLRAFTAPTVAIEDAGADMFRPFLDEAFVVSGAGGTDRLVLAKIRELPLTRNVAQFSLIFHAPAAASLADGIYEFHHPAAGSFSLFIVPIGAPDAQRRVYQACFSRHVRA